MRRTRWLAALALLASAVALLWAAAPPPSLTVRAATASGDTVWIKVTYGLTGNFQASDTVAVDYYRSGGLVLGRRTRAAVDSARLASLVLPGQTQTFKACTRVERSGLVSGEKCSGTVSWTRPVLATAPQAADSIRATAFLQTSDTTARMVLRWWVSDTGYTSTLSFGVDSGASWSGSDSRPGLTTLDTVLVKSPPAGASWWYWFCVVDWRSGLSSALRCNRALYQRPAAPAPPDTTGTPSVTVLGLVAWPGTVTLGGSNPDGSCSLAPCRQQFCAFATLSDGSVAGDLKPAGHPGIAYCDSVGRSLYGVRYSLRWRIAVPPALWVRLASR
jgi:hypothetical protein